MLSRKLCRSYRNTDGRHGLTLLELVVVMAILAALAGILVPLFPNLIYKAHTSTGATNLGEIAKAVQLYAANNGNNYPSNFDSLVTTGSTATTGLASYVADQTSDLTASSLQSADLNALNAAGISAVVSMVENPNTPNTSGDHQNDWSPTFYPYGNDSSVTPTSGTLSTSSKVAYLSPTVAASKFAVSAAGTYVVFGLGKYCTLASTGMDEAPVWYNPSQGYDPDSKYCRFGLVFQTADVNGPLSMAKFLGPVELAQWGVMTKDDNLSFNYSLK